MTEAVSCQADVLSIEAEGVPPDLPASTYEMILRGAAMDPQAPALSFFLQAGDHKRPESWTYAELVRDITRAANAFARMGVGRDDVVAYVLPNLPETHFVIWGGEAVGIVCAINPLLEGTAIAELLNAAGAKVLVTLAPFPGVDLWAKIQPILADCRSIEHLVLVDLADRVPGLRRHAAKFLRRLDVWRRYGFGGVRGTVPGRIRLHAFRRALMRESGAGLAGGRPPEADDISSMFCTGGTTGIPKLALRRHGNEVANAWSAGRVFGDGIGPGKTVFCGLPLFHVNAVMVTGLIPFFKGAHVLLGTPQGYRGKDVVSRFWEIVEHHRIYLFSGVPTLYAALLDLPLNGRDVSSLRFGLCGAAPMPVEVFRLFEERTGIRILEGYGLTEGVCISSVNPPDGPRRIGSIGLRLPGQDMKAVILDDAGGYVRDCAEDEPGIIAIAGPNIFCGYALEEQNGALWIDMGDGRSWLNTGDLGRRDAEGYFFLTGRKKDLIIRGGHNIDPALIEQPLHRHSAVQLAAAIGRPDAHAGELPVAYVQLKAGAAASESELIEFLREEIGERAALPKRVHIIDAMPLTPVGKIFKPALKKREISDALHSALAEAGLTPAELAVEDARTGGMIIRLLLDAPDQEDRARSVLGRFPFALSVGWRRESS